MDRKFLESLGLEKEAIEKVMAEHGKTVQAAKPTDYDDLKSAKETLESQVEQLNGTLTAANEKYTGYDKNLESITNELNSHKTQSLKISIASRAGIPIEYADRLRGDSEDELKADAEKFAPFVKPAPLPLKPTETNEVDKTSPYKSMLENLNLKGEK